jgi:hypothetical protein
MTSPNVWIGCPACYDDARLVGAWVDLAYCHYWRCPNGHDDGPALVFDADGPTPWHGETTVTTAHAWGVVMEDLDDREVTPFCAYCQNDGSLEPGPDIVDLFREAYAGEYMDPAELAQDLADNLAAPTDWPWVYVDWERAGRDLMMGDYWSDGPYYFRAL